MSGRDIRPSGVERFFGLDEIIVSKTNPKGLITYTNDVFIRVSGYTEHELIGAPHSLIRHPQMPRAVFKLLWDTIESGREIFAYVLNMSKNGDHYWVLAHVTPTFGAKGDIVGYHSNRRLPARSAVDRIWPIYQQLLAEEARHERKLDGVAAATRLLGEVLQRAGQTYDEFVWALTNEAAPREAA
jgi:PAS domain S-box-containing protein